MKTLNHISVIAITLIAMVFSSCNDEWKNHYKEGDPIIDNENIASVNAKAVEFLQSESSLSSVFNLFNETGMVDRINSSSQLHTFLVVNNDVSVPDVDDRTYFAKTHIASVGLSPSYIPDNGMRLLMINGKYLTVTKSRSSSALASKAPSETPEDSLTGGYSIYFNDIKVTRITKVNDGYVYELEDYIVAPKSMLEVIRDLDDNYSIFREMVLGKATRVFNKAASKPIGVDATGNTVYDSIFVETFDYFTKLGKGFDLTSESVTATMLIPSNDLVTQAIEEGKLYLKFSGAQRHDTILENWIFQSAFFNKMYEPTDFQNIVDMTSIFGKQWRNTVQRVDLNSRMVMSNGLAYKTEYLKLPVNLLIYRLKDYFKYYEKMTADEKLFFFKETNLIYNKTVMEVGPWSGWPAMGFPYIDNTVVYFRLDSIGKEKCEFRLEFTAVRCTDNKDGTYLMEPFVIPPGEYTLHFGFKEYKTPPVNKYPGNWAVFFNNDSVYTIPQTQHLTTNFHYDRNGSGYPEGYDKDHKGVTDPPDLKKNTYDMDGTKVATITIRGEGPQPVKFTFHGRNLGPDADIIFHHWCLRPTANCY